MNTLRYVPLRGGDTNPKAPKYSMTNDNMVTLEQAEKLDSFGVFMEYPYVVIDIDDLETGDIVYEIIKDEEINSRVYKTDRGYHFWFKHEEDEIPSTSAKMNALGIKFDTKGWGVNKRTGEEKKAQVVLRLDGVDRPCIEDVALDDLDEIPVFLNMVSSHMLNKYDMYNMDDGDGRNETLFSYIILLQKSGMSQVDIKYTLNLINDYVFRKPLSQSEMDVILRDEAFLDMDEIIGDDIYDYEKGRLLHHAFAPKLIDMLDIKYVDGDFYIHKDGYYQKAAHEIERKMIDIIPPLTRNNRAETLDYIRLQSIIENPPQDVYSVNLRNGRLDMSTGKLTPHNARYFDTARVDVEYDENAYCEITHKMLQKVTCGDQELFDLLTQIIGYSLVKHNNYQVMFYLHGNSASNGKSTILDMITAFVGENNVTTLSIKDLNDEYKPAELQHKLLNVGDDQSSLNIRESDVFKKVVSGEGILVARKYGQPFQLRNYSTMLFAGNDLPSFSDKGEGVNRRIVILPFNAKFKRTDPDFNPNIGEDVTTDKAKSYLLNLALKGYQTVERNKGFVRPKASEEAFEEFKNTSSTVMMWLTDVGKSSEDLIGQSRNAIYQQYYNYSLDSGIKNPVGRTKFVREIKENLNLGTKQERIAGTNERHYVFVEEES